MKMRGTETFPMAVKGPRGGAAPASPAPAGRRPGLDLIRAVAICSVVFAHSSMFWRQGEGGGGAATLRGFGVDLFFALSGYLIGGQISERLRGSDSRGASNSSEFQRVKSGLPTSSASPASSAPKRKIRPRP